jgi:GH24 family phage-related lysozyme (muramidase)
MNRDALVRQWIAHWEAANDASFGADPPSEFASLVAFAHKFPQPLTQGTGIAPGFQATRASVANSFVSWSTPFEGYTDYPYTDAEGLVTVGMGNLIDTLAPGQTLHVNCGHGTKTPAGLSAPTAAARALPWTGGNIATDWARIKSAWPGVQSTACKGITSCRLDKATIAHLILYQMVKNEAEIIKDIPGFAKAPADAQLTVHSMSWAMGPGQFAHSWTAFRNAMNSGDYAAAAAQSGMRGVGIGMRNLANKLLLLNSAAVAKMGGNPDRLYYLDGLTQLGEHVAEAGIAAAKAAGGGLLDAVRDNPGKSALAVAGAVVVATLAARRKSA